MNLGPLTSRMQADGARRSRRLLPPAVAAVAAVAAVLAVVGVITLIGSGSRHPAVVSDKVTMVQVDAAALRGLPVTVVRRKLTSRGLRFHVRWRASDRERPGLVLAVRPAGCPRSARSSSWPPWRRARTIVRPAPIRRNRFRMNLGRARAHYGRATGNRSLQARGRRQRIVNTTRHVGEQVKDSGKNIRGGLR
ncbi:MAG TPA: CsbD family protein [Streptosporangiaceae bacterium]|nr:CsbD family protein [Streptosporangiaceae bacterium]